MNKPIEILLVEDSPADISLTEEALKDSGVLYRLSVVNDGEQAMDYLLKKSSYANSATPDVILLDLNMPKKTGHEVLAEMKEYPRLLEIPVVVLTVSQAEEDHAKALALNMNYYMSKPVTAVRLASILEAINDLWSLSAG